MKKIAFILILGSVLSSCMKTTDQFKISGIVKGIDTGMVFLQKYEQEIWVNVDSVKLAKGAFAFTGKSDLPEMWHIVMPDGQLVLPVFLENSAIEIEILPESIEKSTIKGSATQDVYQKYLSMDEALNVKMEEVYTAYNKARKANDTVGMERNDSIISTLDAAAKKQLQDFAKANNKSVVAPFLVIKNSWQFELPELEELAAAMDTSLNRSQYLVEVKKRIEILRRVAIGQIAPDFTMNDSTGKPVALSSLKGKILLLDFWASWCGPCRGENPNVVKAYQAYSKKGFDVLGCSFDQSREKWLSAVKEDNLTWTQVSDLKRWGNEAGKLYGIKSIPANVLLDKDQKIIGRNLRGEDLMKKLEELLGPAIPEKKAGRGKK
jgi:peroxiredoxin